MPFILATQGSSDITMDMTAKSEVLKIRDVFQKEGPLEEVGDACATLMQGNSFH